MAKSISFNLFPFLGVSICPSLALCEKAQAPLDKQSRKATTFVGQDCSLWYFEENKNPCRQELHDIQGQKLYRPDLAQREWTYIRLKWGLVAVDSLSAKNNEKVHLKQQ